MDALAVAHALALGGRAGMRGARGEDAKFRPTATRVCVLGELAVGAGELGLVGGRGAGFVRAVSGERPDFPAAIYTEWATSVATRSNHIPFAVDAAGRDRDASEVERGLRCGCRCPACGGVVVARQGEVRAPHFAHHSRKECVHALEASLFRGTIAMLTAPGAMLRLPPLGSRHELAAYHGASFTEAQAAKFFATAWVVEGRAAPLEGLEVRAREIAASVVAAADLVVAPLGLEIHLLSYRKNAAQVRAGLGGGAGRVLGIDLRAYAKLWWDSCESDRAAKVVRASQALRRWLREEEGGRGWLAHPEFEERARRLREWTARHPRPEPAEQNRYAPAPLYVQSEPLARAVAEPDRPDTVLRRNVGSCEVCGLPLEEIAFGSGQHTGRRAIVCSHLRLHHTELLD